MFKKDQSDNVSFRALTFGFLFIAAVIIIRLFYLQVIEHNYYATFALSSHEISEQLHPKRGDIYFQDSRNSEVRYPAAIIRQYYLVYAVPKEIKAEEKNDVINKMIEIFGYTEADKEKKEDLTMRLSKINDQYEPLAKKVSEETINKIKQATLPGIYYIGENWRYYPEENLASNILGFSRLDDNGNLVGSYGLEGYWNKQLAGKSGLLIGERSALGSIIAAAGKITVQAEDGADLVLTIDRALQNYACDSLKKEMENNQAKSASLVMMESKTGAILAMCSLPDFNPNNFSAVKDLKSFNNTNIFIPYEPGSVFKPLTMAAALDTGLVSPNTTFTDPCLRKIDGFTVRNAQDKCYGTITMTGVLENSVNTGMIWVEEKLGRERFLNYINKFGFGEKTGIELSSEMPGDISSLSKKGAIYGAAASFGQGITVTPIQIAAAYAAIANQGQMPKPFIVREIDYANGKKDITEPIISEKVLTPRAAQLLTGMLISDIENGHSKATKLKDYYLAGKTGTAQIAGKGGYIEDATNHTFAGFGPATNPKIVLVVKFEEPKSAWADYTAGPVFKEVMDFTLKYFALPKDK